MMGGAVSGGVHETLSVSYSQEMKASRSLVFFFFFSSRRRHTRSIRDWSSDVCSSDLIVHFLPLLGLEWSVHNRRCGCQTGETVPSLSLMTLATSSRPSLAMASLLPMSPRWLGITRSEEHTSELQSRFDIVCRLLLEKK